MPNPNPRFYGKMPPKKDYKFKCKKCRTKYTTKNLLNNKDVCVKCLVDEFNKDKQREILNNMLVTRYIKN